MRDRLRKDPFLFLLCLAGLASITWAFALTWWVTGASLALAVLETDVTGLARRQPVLGRVDILKLVSAVIVAQREAYGLAFEPAND